VVERKRRSRKVEKSKGQKVRRSEGLKVGEKRKKKLKK
jgi:hypothetical protein